MRTWLAWISCVTAILGGTVQAAPTAPDPFVATYSVSYRGISAGNLKFSLTRDAATGRYVYETRVEPTMLARLVVSGAAVERSVMEIGPDGVRPIEWQLDDGKSSDADDGHLNFDWPRGRVTGRVKQKNIDLPIEPGVQDRLSIQIAVVVALMQGREPGTVSLVDNDQVKRYLYTRKEATAVDTPLGKLDTVVYESTREGGSSRVSRFWLAPSQQYTPARAEQVRKGKVETVMTLTKVEKPAT
jgi:Protein of unknown function (DUF3108)